MAYSIKIMASDNNAHIFENTKSYTSYIAYAGSKGDDTYNKWLEEKDDDDTIFIIPPGDVAVWMQATNLSDGNVAIYNEKLQKTMSQSLHTPNIYDHTVSVSKNHAVVARHSK